jgi:hypothetical protein
MTLLDDVKRGCQQPSTLHLPEGVESPHSDDAIELAAIAGLFLDEWQQNVLRWSLMAHTDGRWGAREVGLVVARQNGKGSVLEARQLAGLFILGERLALHTAHEFKTCYEHFRRVVGLVEDTPSLSKLVKIIRTGAGDQAIELKNGNRLRFLARSRSSGRGFSGDAVYLDEAFELSDATIGALLPALSARPNPQLWLTSSAPHASSEVLHRLRDRGRAGDDPRLLYCEWGNEPDTDPTDRDGWRRANPGLGIRISESSVEQERRSMSPSEFARERLGVPDLPDGSSGVIDVARWNGLTDAGSKVSGPVEIAFELSPDRLRSSFAVAGRRADGLLHVELIDQFPGTAGVVARAVELSNKYRTPIIVDPGSPAGALIPSMVEAGADVHEVSSRELTQACGALVDAVNVGSLRHIGQVPLSNAVAAGRARTVGDAWAWARMSSAADVTPLVAVSLAVGRVPGRRESVPLAAFV